MKTCVTLILCVVSACLLAGCQPHDQKAADNEADAQNQKKYVRPPRFTEVIQVGSAAFQFSGQAQENGRFGIVFSGRNAAGQPFQSTGAAPVDSKGRFTSKPVPSGPLGGIYDLEDSVLAVHAEGRLFVPLNATAKAVVLMPGGASWKLNDDNLVLSVVDFDSAGGLTVTGHCKSGQTVDLIMNGTAYARTQCDTAGHYNLLSQIPPPTAQPVSIVLAIDAGADKAQKTISVSLPHNADQISRLPDGWRVDWALPGGGGQSTLVY